MTMKAVVTDINTIDESLRGEYKESDGKYILDVEAVETTTSTGTTARYALEDVNGMKTALQRERTAARAAQEVAAQFKDLDVTTVRFSLAELKLLKEQGGDLEERATALSQSKIDQLVVNHESAIQASKGTTDKYRSKIDDLMIDQTLASTIRLNGGDEGTVKLLMPHLKQHVSVREAGDNFITEVVDQVTREPRIGDAQGSPMSLSQLVVEFRDNDTYASAFPGSGKSGGGSKTSGKRGSGFPGKRSEYSAAQRSDFIEKNGALGWLSLPE